MVSVSLKRSKVELHAPVVRRVIVRSKLEQLTEEERERYVLENVEQSEELAEELQYLVGYFDDESGHLYEVQSVFYYEEHKAMIACRRAIDGKTHQLNDSPHFLYGDGGVLQLCELWDIMIKVGSGGQI